MEQGIMIFREECILAARGKEGKIPQFTDIKRIELRGRSDMYEQWFQALLSLKREWNLQKVKIIFPANLCETRILQLPEANKKELKDMLRKELMENFRSELVDYSVIQSVKKKGNTICCVGVDNTIFKNFQQLFDKAGIVLEDATAPMEGYLRILQRVEGYNNQTAIYLFFEDGNVTSILCENGEYQYSSRSRLFSEPGTLDFGTEIVRNISGILQFYSTNKKENAISNVYYVGCEKEDFEVSIDGIRNLNLDVEAMRFTDINPGTWKLEDWIACVGAMIRESKKLKKISLVKVLNDTLQAETKKMSIWANIILPILALTICLGAWGITGILNSSLNKEISVLQEWTERLEIIESYDRATELILKLEKAESAVEDVKLLENNLGTYPEFTSSVKEKMEDIGGDAISIHITGYQSEGGVVTFLARSNKVIDIPSYISRLEKSGLFYSVDYDGYRYEDDVYELSLSCVMQGRVQEAETEDKS